MGGKGQIPAIFLNILLPVVFLNIHTHFDTCVAIPHHFDCGLHPLPSCFQHTSSNLFYIYTATNLPLAFSRDLYINICQHKWNNSNYILFNSIQPSRPPILTAPLKCTIRMLSTNNDLFCLAKFYSEINHLYLNVVLSF